MENKKYSISQVQKLMDISPTELQKLMRQNRKHIYLEFIEDSDGVQVAHIDANSLKKLIFLKQLKNGSNINTKEACEQMNTSYSISSGNDTKIYSILNTLEEEIMQLSSKINTLISKYEYAIKELSQSHAVNISLSKRINMLEARQITLLEQINHASEDVELNFKIIDQAIN